MDRPSTSASPPRCSDECISQLPGSPPEFPFQTVPFQKLLGKMLCLFKPRQKCEKIQVSYFTKNKNMAGPTHVYFTEAKTSSCGLLHSSFNNQNYCYFYVDLFKSLRAPRQTTGYTVKLGNHVTFGPSNKYSNSVYEVHNTEYAMKISRQNTVSYEKRIVHWYTVRPDSTLNAERRSTPFYNYAVDGWKHIVGFVHDHLSNSGGARCKRLKKVGGTGDGNGNGQSPALPSIIAKTGQPSSPTLGTPPGVTPGTIARPTREETTNSDIDRVSITEDKITYSEFRYKLKKGDTNTNDFLDYILVNSAKKQAEDINVFVEWFRGTIQETDNSIYMVWNSDDFYHVIGNAISQEEFPKDKQTSSSSVARKLFPNPAPPS